MKILHIFLEEDFKASAEKGTHNFMNRTESAMSRVGYDVQYHLNSIENRTKSAGLAGYSLFHMKEPLHSRALCFRRAYYYPFWRIETTAERWKFRVAKMPFPPRKQDADQAERFANSMRKRHFASLNASRGGYIYMPLQGRLLERRSFQTCSPIEMIEQTLSTDKKRPILARLHPNETYSEKEIKALKSIEKKHDRFALSDAPSDVLVAACDYTVTQNSSAALGGYFFHKPAVLFAKIDFHHIAGNVADMGLQDAFEHAQDPDKPFDKYMLWFLRKTSINAGNPNAETRILAAMRKSGWEI
ncbi:hypothetical protein ACFE33_01340 [Falsihalocynthiibacter sp. SS001]|uniref:hypothetical protein n=1 Tax=Falsihalocynthiibacter sp. SS001 TaxID=3349698 RepID=UPI0036D2E1F0